jgi:hypothetical protein
MSWQVMVFALVSYSFGLRMWANVFLFIGSTEEYSGCLGGGAVVILGFNSWNF